MENMPRYNQTHLIENRRIELACDYLVHEFRKIFSSITHEEAHRAIRNLTPNETSDDERIRDFWNLFCSISTGWKLKDLYDIVTDENISWRKEEISIKFLNPKTPQDLIENINPYDFDEAVAYLKRNKEELKKALEKSDRMRDNRANGDEDDPIIAINNNEYLKVEEVYLNEYHDINDAWDNIQRFIEDVYNKKRLHSSLGYKSPVDFEKEVALNIA